MYCTRCQAVLVTCMLAVVVSLFAFSVPARARGPWRLHHDLASLALEADAIVVAERTGGSDNAVAYRVMRVLAGQGLRAGDAITIDQAVYITDGGTAPIEPIAILFLKRVTAQPSELGWSLVPSGLRIFQDGRAYRFEESIFKYDPVPQGRDPEDHYGIETGVQWDRAELEHAIAGAVERADLARAAIAARDPVRILALMPVAPIAGEPWDHSGLYEDRIAVRGFDALIAAGEIDGALDVYARIHGERPWAAHIDETALLARAESSSAPLSRRVAALSLFGELTSDDTLHSLFAIARDVNAPAALRIAAIRALAYDAGIGSSKAGWPARQRQRKAGLQSLVRELVSHAPDSLRVELVSCAARFELQGAVPVQHEIAASALQRDRFVVYHVAAAPGVNAYLTLEGATKLLRSDGTACDATPRESWFGIGWGGRIDAGQCPEASQVRIEVRRDGRDYAWTIPIERCVRSAPCPVPRCD